MRSALGISVLPYPNDTRAYFLKGKNSELLVRYEGSVFAEQDIALFTR